jgi:dTDP-glucose 4,6-dehydratase
MVAKVVAVTGCLGFLGTHVLHRLMAHDIRVYGFDAETYAANQEWLAWYRSSPTRSTDCFKYQRADVCTLEHLPDVDAIIHLAAETHVDRSVLDAATFVRTNVLGTQHLLDLACGKRQYQMPLFLHVSTDEVYGSVADGSTPETAPLAPSSPYAASKAAADHLVMAYGHTYGLPWRMVRPSNCYGTRQYPEKLIPKAIRCLTLGKPIPIHEGGLATRSWLDVDDCAEAILTVLERGATGEIYNVGGNTERSVRDVATLVIEAFHGPTPEPAQYLDLGFTRLGLDQRYHVDDTKLRALGWIPAGNLDRDVPVLVETERRVFRW